MTNSETPEVVTGMIPVGPPDCPKHRETAKNADGSMRWCGRCGWTHDYKGGGPVRMAPGNGGW